MSLAEIGVDAILHSRPDGTYVITYRGSPYHVTLDDPLYDQVAEAAQGLDLPPEMPPAVPGPVISAPGAIPGTEPYVAAITAHLDAVVRERGYDSILSAVSYPGDPDPQYNADGRAARAWRSAVWRYVNAELDKVLAGERAQPSVAELIAELPVIVWPEAEQPAA